MADTTDTIADVERTLREANFTELGYGEYRRDTAEGESCRVLIYGIGTSVNVWAKTERVPAILAALDGKALTIEAAALTLAQAMVHEYGDGNVFRAPSLSPVPLTAEELAHLMLAAYTGQQRLASQLAAAESAPTGA